MPGVNPLPGLAAGDGDRSTVVAVGCRLRGRSVTVSPEVYLEALEKEKEMEKEKAKEMEKAGKKETCYKKGAKEAGAKKDA